MKYVKHWQDPTNAVLGGALILAPFAAEFTGEMVPTLNAVIVGLALVVTALGAMIAPKAWEEWTEAILGLWMIMSPWVLAYSHVQSAMYVAVAIGVVVVLLALWTLATDKDYSLPKSMLP
jgi:SPW repeat